MKPVFLDTVGLIALWDEADQWHPVAKPVFSALLAGHQTMVTTTSVLLECGNAAARRVYRLNVYDLRQKMLANNSLIDPSSEEIEQAWSDYRASLAGEAGIVDHVSFAIMRRLSITHAFTNDAHFRAAGFETMF
ncbi:MAG TPA: hypothetical protein VNX28_12000, partial [Gemmataceae bacterium]|jgi:predicted nucleic acid-binding protein|nr:hypothetical protein [Gemmataceae bacterium]